MIDARSRAAVRASLLVALVFATTSCWTPEWTYSEPNGPEQWGDLATEWRLAMSCLATS